MMNSFSGVVVEPDRAPGISVIRPQLSNFIHLFRESAASAATPVDSICDVSRENKRNAVEAERIPRNRFYCFIENGSRILCIRTELMHERFFLFKVFVSF